MLGVLLMVLLVGLALAAILYVGSVWLQGIFYSEPAEQLYWRAPAAAGVITAYLALLGYLTYRNPNNFDSFLRFSATEDREFTEFDAVPEGQKPIHFKKDPLTNSYRDSANHPWTRSVGNAIVSEIIVKEERDGSSQESHFKADLDNGHFKKEANYIDENGRVMPEVYLGHVSRLRWGAFFVNLFLNLVHLALWFVCLWLLLRFQWGHALGLAVPLWGAVTLILIPMLVDRAREAAAEKPRPAQTATAFDAERPLSLVSRGGLTASPWGTPIGAEK